MAFLHKRYEVFNGAADKGMVIVPTELLVDNGKKLEAIVLQLAKNNNLSEDFITWLTSANYFCSSLVDRIVPGKLPAEQQKTVEEKLGYEDALLISSEPYRLWAIEASSEKVNNALSFAKADSGVIIAPDINVFRELKLRLLNGTHTYSCGVAVLAGFLTVKEAMENKMMSAFISNIMLNEIVPVIAKGAITKEMANDFANKVIDRFRNPYIEHKWLSITVQYTSKMKMRNLPVLLKHYEENTSVPQYMALGFAAYILFMQTENVDGKFVGSNINGNYTIEDDSAALLHAIWQANNQSTIVNAVLSNTDLWGSDITKLNGFEEAVNHYLQSLAVNPTATIEQLILK